MGKLYKRKITDLLTKYLNDKEALVLHGARQVGKTSVLHYIMEEVLKKEKKGNIYSILIWKILHCWNFVTAEWRMLYRI